MFTGIVTHSGTLISLVNNKNKDLLATIQITYNNSIPGFTIGSSIACNGICLTLVKTVRNDQFLLFDFQLSKETIACSNAKLWKVGDQINIEFSLKIGDELGGHWVSGHIDDTVTVKKITKIADSHFFQFQSKKALRQFICHKGSVALNGVSLTVNEVKGNFFSVNIIEHTMKNTNFSNLQIGDEVNIEIDIIARYLNNLIKINDTK